MIKLKTLVCALIMCSLYFFLSCDDLIYLTSDTYYDSDDSNTDSTASSESPAGPVGLGLVGYYQFNYAAGLENSDDSISANPINFTNTNAGSDRFFSLNQGAEFESASLHYKTIPSHPNLDFTTGMSICVWIYPYTGVTDRKIIGRANVGLNNQWVLGINGAANYDIHWEVWDSTTALYSLSTTGEPVAINNWWHMAVTWQSGGKQRIYLNGALVAEQDASINPIYPSGGDDIVIGEAPWGGAGAFWLRGSVDDIKLYDIPLTAAQVSSLYLGEKPP